MASTIQSLNDSNKDDDNDNKLKKTEDKYEEMLEILPKVKEGWVTNSMLNYDGAWFIPSVLKGVVMAQDHFKALPTDVFLVTFPKSGTTWLKALTFTILNRETFDFLQHPLLTKNPHECCPFLELFCPQEQQKIYHLDDDDCPCARVLSTHTPYHILPESIRCSSTCRIVYMIRDAKDVFVSSWYHMEKVRPKELPPLSMAEAFDLFCRGVYQFGPYWDHVLGYWKASIDEPEKVLILRYEDMKRDPLGCVRKLATHLGHPFSPQEERDGVLEEIVKLCSFETLSNLEVNKSGVQHFTSEVTIENHVFFRKGGVRDWEKHLTLEMAQRLDGISEQRFEGTHLMSSISP